MSDPFHDENNLLSWLADGDDAREPLGEPAGPALGALVAQGLVELRAVPGSGLFAIVLTSAGRIRLRALEE